jgi:hypothetical protein
MANIFFGKVKGTNRYNTIGFPVLETDTAGNMQMALNLISSGQILHIAPGIYSGSDFNSSGGSDGLNTKNNNQTIRCAGLVIFDFTGYSDHGIQGTSYSGFSIKGFSIKEPMVFMGIAATKLSLFVNIAELSNIRVLGNGTGGRVSTRSGGVINNLEINDIGGVSASLDVYGANAINNIVLNNVVIKRGNNQVPAININTFAATSQIQFNNLIAYGNYGTVFRQSSNCLGSIEINNSILVASNSADYIIQNQSIENLVVNNSIIHGGARGADSYFISENVTLNYCIHTLDPLWRKTSYPYKIAFVVDDLGNLDWFKNTVVPKLEAYGYKGVFGLSGTHIATEQNWSDMRALEASGHEIACHTRHHIQLGTLLTSKVPFTIQRTGQTASMLDGVLVTSTPHSYTLSNYTMAGLRTQMANNGYTVGTLEAGYDTLPATLIKNFSSISINSVYSLGMNATRTFDEEIYNSKQDMISNGLNPKTFVPPGNSTSVALRTYLKNVAFFDGARGGGTVGKTLSSFSIFDIGCRDFHLFFKSTSACISNGNLYASCLQRNIVADLVWMGSQGIVMAYYTHGEAEWNADEWDTLLEVVTQAQTNVTTLTGLVEFGKTFCPSGDLATADGDIYTRTLIDEFSTRLQSISPCVDVGGWISGINDQGDPDPWENYIHRLPNIGPDQGAGAPKTGRSRILNICDGNMH